MAAHNPVRTVREEHDVSDPRATAFSTVVEQPPGRTALRRARCV